MFSTSGFSDNSEDVSATYSEGQQPSIGLAQSPEANRGGGFPLLFDSGPLVTSAGTGLNGEDESVLQTTSLGMNILGAGAQSSGATDNRVADDFEAIHGGWQLEEIVVYAYQTGEVASTITGVTLQIWDGFPGDVGSSVVFGDNTTNVLTSTAFSGILRVTEESTGTADNRQITANVITIGTFLPEGTYWVDYQFTGSGASGPWAPPITIIGQTTTGNGIQQINATSPDWNPYLDSGTNTQQGFPIQYYGTEPDLIFEDGFQTVVVPPR